jgi:pimeloyl-ACP methyl ester carboxylesterase
MVFDIKTVELPNGVRLPYVEQGDPAGIPLLLVHAVGDSWRSFERVLADLPHTIHAYAMTLRGHGDASRPAEGYRPSDFAADLLAFMDALGIEAAVVAGGSSSGVVVQRLAIDHPERVLGLVLLGSPLTFRDKPWAREFVESTIFGLIDPLDPEFAREFAEGVLARPVPQDFLDAMVQESLKAPARVWQATFAGSLEEDCADELDRIQAPTLIIWGDADTTVPREDQEAMAAAIPNARLLIYREAGHLFYWEDPESVADDLATFVWQISAIESGSPLELPPMDESGG